MVPTTHRPLTRTIAQAAVVPAPLHSAAWVLVSKGRRICISSMTMASPGVRQTSGTQSKPTSTTRITSDEPRPRWARFLKWKEGHPVV